MQRSTEMRTRWLETLWKEWMKEKDVGKTKTSRSGGDQAVLIFLNYNLNVTWRLLWENSLQQPWGRSRTTEKQVVNPHPSEGCNLLWVTVTLGRMKIHLDNYKSQGKKQDWGDSRHHWKKSVHYSILIYESVMHHESPYCTFCSAELH